MADIETDTFEQTLERMVENLFDELVSDLERVQKGKDTALEYAQNVVATGEHFHTDVLAAHNQAIAQAVREELEKLKAKAQYFGHNNFSTILASDINERISQLGEQAE